MGCLLPQFKCPPDPLTIHFTASNLHSHHLKTREYFCFRVLCLSSSTTAVVHVEKRQTASLEAHLNSVAAVRPLTYVGIMGPPTKTSYEAMLATETLQRSQEALIAIAAAEAVSLAKEAVEVAKSAAAMVATSKTFMTTSDKFEGDFLHENDIHRLKGAWLIEVDRIASVAYSATTGDHHIPENDNTQYSAEDIETSRPIDYELELLQMQQHPENTVVRSVRQTERRVRREKLAEKAAESVVLVKSGSSRRKRRSPLQEIDYSDPLRFLRATTDTSRLLTATEELEYSEGIQGLLKLEKVHKELVERCGGQPTFSQWAAAAWVDQKTLRTRLNYGIFCKDKMIKSNIRLVISIAKNYQGAGMNLQDLVQEGCRGLVRGAEKFDASKGFRFSTYAHWWIKQAVRKSLSEQSRTIRLPFHMVEATYRVKEARKKLFSDNGRYPDNKEVAEATGLSMKRLISVLLTPKAPRSLDQKIGINQNLKPSEVIANPDDETAEELLIKQYMKEELHKVLDSLSPREKQVVRWRFGLEDGRMKTLQEIGELMGVSRERIRQIESCAFRKLKNKKRTKSLRQYVLT